MQLVVIIQITRLADNCIYSNRQKELQQKIDTVVVKSEKLSLCLNNKKTGLTVGPKKAFRINVHLKLIVLICGKFGHSSGIKWKMHHRDKEHNCYF